MTELIVTTHARKFYYAATRLKRKVATIIKARWPSLASDESREYNTRGIIYESTIDQYCFDRLTFRLMIADDE